MDNKNSSYEHKDDLAFLNRHGTLRDKLVSAHEALRISLPFIARIALALYDPETRILKTYLHSSDDENPLENYQAQIDQAPSLKELLARGQPRVINSMVTHERDEPEHTQRLGRSGYAASYTLPVFNNGDFMGFLFFNSREPDVFDEKALHELDLYGHMISLMVISELSAIQILGAAVSTTRHITHQRDPETGSHLDRMSRYSRIIAKELAEKYDLDDDYIEHIFMFAPLHDIGKISIPDSILLKPGSLTAEEMAVMRTHTHKGREMIDELLANFGLENVEHVDMLRNIAGYHHEFLNGKGYPEGKVGDEIPLESRIIAVADVFDAMTSRRPYKEAWSNEKAFEALQELAGEQLEQECVDALLANRDRIEVIQQLFRENLLD